MQMRSSPRMSSFALGSWFCASCCPMPIKSFLVHFTQLYSCVQWEAKTEILKTGSNSCGYSYSFSFFFSFFFFFFSVTALFYLEPSHSLSPLFLPPPLSFFLFILPSSATKMIISATVRSYLLFHCLKCFQQIHPLNVDNIHYFPGCLYT